MITFDQMVRQTISNCGIYYEDAETEEIKRNIRHAIRDFMNSSARFWDRKEKHTNLKGGQQFYQISTDMHRVREVKAVAGGITMPLKEIQSEDEWNMLNSVPSSSNYPEYYFIKGSDEVGIFPTPSEDITGGLIVAYSPRIPDFSMQDVETTVDVVQNSTRLIMRGEDKAKTAWRNEVYVIFTSDGDGFAYKVAKIIDEDNIDIENNFLGETQDGAPVIIGQCPPFPDEYHEAPIFFATARFFAKRKDQDSVAMYQTLYKDALDDYKKVYGTKSEHQVITPRRYVRRAGLADMFRSSTIKEG